LGYLLIFVLEANTRSQRLLSMTIKFLSDREQPEDSNAFDTGVLIRAARVLYWRLTDSQCRV